jgi:hypothetical protein
MITSITLKPLYGAIASGNTFRPFNKKLLHRLLCGKYKNGIARQPTGFPFKAGFSLRSSRLVRVWTGGTYLDRSLFLTPIVK